MLAAESAEVRLSLVNYLQQGGGRGATAALAKQAVFDLDPEVRARARYALKGHAAEHYTPVLLDALRYPWAPVAERAAETLPDLKAREPVPQLVRLLDEPDPTAPFLKAVDGRETPVVRELVRVNHFRNCLLCHAPSAGGRDELRGRIPVPGAPIPDSRTLY